MLLHPTSLQFKQNKVLNLALLEFIGFWCFGFVLTGGNHYFLPILATFSALKFKN